LVCGRCRSSCPSRRWLPNRDLRTREHLTEAEVERLMEVAKANRHGRCRGRADLNNGEWFSVPPEMAVAAIARAAQKLGHPIVQLSPDRAAGTVAVARAQEAAAAQPKRSLLTSAQKAFLLIVLLAVVVVVVLARLARI
jgi:hypothetical protein